MFNVNRCCSLTSRKLSLAFNFLTENLYPVVKYTVDPSRFFLQGLDFFPQLLDFWQRTKESFFWTCPWGVLPNKKQYAQLN